MRGGTSVNRSYPLASGSRARRRILLNQARDEVAQSVGLPIDIDEIDEDEADVLGAADGGPSEATGDEPHIGILPASTQSGIRAVSRLLAGSQPVTWVFTGDSITHGAQHTQGGRSFSEHFAERVRWELRRFLDVVINTGVAGEKSTGLLKNLDWRASRFHPDVVSVLIGIKDAASGPDGRELFRGNLRQIISRLRDHGAIVLLHTPNHVDPERAKSLADVRAYVKIIRETARELDVACIDHWAHWKQSKSHEESFRAWLAEDGIHPSALGHREMAKLVFAKLGIFDEQSPTCCTRVP